MPKFSTKITNAGGARWKIHVYRDGKRVKGYSCVEYTRTVAELTARLMVINAEREWLEQHPEDAQA